MKTTVMDLTLFEAAHLTDLVGQFAELVTEAGGAGTGGGVTADPAVARLVPDAYPDDPSAAGEFRRLTEGDLLHRKAEDAGTVLATLLYDGEHLSPRSLDSATAQTPWQVRLDPTQRGAWLRTLAALRLVLASRLGISDEDDHIEDDPRFGVYDWLGYRLEMLVQAIDRGD